MRDGPSHSYVSITELTRTYQDPPGYTRGGLHELLWASELAGLRGTHGEGHLHFVEVNVEDGRDNQTWPFDRAAKQNCCCGCGPSQSLGKASPTAIQKYPNPFVGAWFGVAPLPRSTGH